MVSVGCIAGHDEAGVAKYYARILYATPTPGLAEVEPSMNWNPSVVAGIGVVADPAVLYQDMHSYLAASGLGFFSCLSSTFFSVFIPV